MAKRTRKTYLLKCIESLEGRALLSALSHRVPAPKSHRIHAQVMPHRVRADLIVPGGPVVTGLTTQAPSGAVNSRPAGLNAGYGNARIRPVVPMAYVPAVGTLNPSSTTTVPGSSIPSNTTGTSSTTVATATATPATIIAAASVVPATAATTATTTASIPMAGLVNGAMPSNGIFGTTLNPTEVASLKTAIDTFATNYTSGTNATKDTAAMTALNSQLNDVALSVWSRNNVIPSAAVTAFQTASNAFAASYTSGTNPTGDVAALKSFQTAMNAFGNSLGSAKGTPALAGLYNLTTMPDPTMISPLGFAGVGTISAADVSGIKTAVDTYAANYTSGTNLAQDKAADLALETAIGNLAMNSVQATTTTVTMPPVVASTPAITPTGLA